MPAGLCIGFARGRPIRGFRPGERRVRGSNGPGSGSGLHKALQYIRAKEGHRMQCVSQHVSASAILPVFFMTVHGVIPFSRKQTQSEGFMDSFPKRPQLFQRHGPLWRPKQTVGVSLGIHVQTDGLQP